MRVIGEILVRPVHQQFAVEAVVVGDLLCVEAVRIALALGRLGFDAKGGVAILGQRVGVGAVGRFVAPIDAVAFFAEPVDVGFGIDCAGIVVMQIAAFG